MSNQNEMSADLAEQIAMLGVDVNDVIANISKPEAVAVPYTPENPTNAGIVTNTVAPQPAAKPIETVARPVETAETLRGEVEFGTITSQTVAKSVQQASAQVVQPTTTVAPYQTVSKPATAVALKDDDDELVFVNLAQAVHTTQTPFLKLKDDEWTRIALIRLDYLIPMRLHYLEGIGWVKCCSKYDANGFMVEPALCCKKVVNGTFVDRLGEDGKPVKAKQRFLLPVIEYPVDRTNGNKVIPGDTPKLKVWNLNYVEMDNLRKAVQGCADDPNDLSSVDLSAIDFKLNKEKSGFKVISVSVAPTSLRAQFATEIDAEISKLNNDFLKTARDESRRIVTEETIANMMDSKEAINAQVNSVIENQAASNESIDSLSI